MGFGFCHVILGNRGGPARGWFSEELPPARALVEGEVPPAQGGASSGPGPGLQLREGPWRGQSPLVSWKRKLLQPKSADSSGEMEGLFFFSPLKVFFLTTLLFFVPETREVVRDARSHCLADLPPPTESQGQSCLPSLGGGGGLWVCDLPIEEALKQSLKTHRQAGSSPFENLFRNLPINGGKRQQRRSTLTIP